MCCWKLRTNRTFHFCICFGKSTVNNIQVFQSWLSRKGQKSWLVVQQPNQAQIFVFDFFGISSSEFFLLFMGKRTQKTWRDTICSPVRVIENDPSRERDQRKRKSDLQGKKNISRVCDSLSCQLSSSTIIDKQNIMKFLWGNWSALLLLLRATSVSSWGEKADWVSTRQHQDSEAAKTRQRDRMVRFDLLTREHLKRRRLQTTPEEEEGHPQVVDALYQGYGEHVSCLHGLRSVGSKTQC